MTVTGDVQPAPDGAQWDLSLADLRALPETQFETHTIWTEGSSRFSGVALGDLLDHVGGARGTLRATALNEYSVTIPTTDAVHGGAMIAYLRDESPMSVRSKGPLWIVYPFDEMPAYQSEIYYSRSIWQLRELHVVAEN
ncbi:MAG: oxidoreductase [Pelagimonas sp.]|nr:oxidoreductase [Pelagimonas sp.]